MEVEWKGRHPKRQVQTSHKVFAYSVVALFLLGLSWWILSIGAGWISVIMILSIYIYSMWSDANR